MSEYAIRALEATTWDAFARLVEKHNGTTACSPTRALCPRSAVCSAVTQLPQEEDEGREPEDEADDLQPSRFDPEARRKEEREDHDPAPMLA